MLIDSHCHLHDKKYEQEIAKVVEESTKSGVEKIVTIGTSLEDSKKAVELARAHDNVFAVVGVHPHEDLDKSLYDIEEGIKEILNSYPSSIVGIGECGLDVPQGEVDYETRDIEEQRELFKMQLGLAVQRELPAVLHNRNSDPELLDVLQLYKDTKLTGVAHCYTSDWDFAKDLLHRDFYVSFSGIVTYPSASKKLLEAVKNIPRDRLLLETDAPFLPPQGHRGEINYPKYVTITAAKVARIRNTPQEEIEKYTYQNTCRLFKI